MFTTVATSFKPEDIVDLEAIGFIPSPKNASDLSRDRNWLQSINIYHLIQKFCTHPAYFWFNYKWEVMQDDKKVLLNTDEIIKLGFGFEVLREIYQGTVDPQAWVDAN